MERSQVKAKAQVTREEENGSEKKTLKRNIREERISLIGRGAVNYKKDIQGNVISKRKIEDFGAKAKKEKKGQASQRLEEMT